MSFTSSLPSLFSSQRIEPELKNKPYYKLNIYIEDLELKEKYKEQEKKNILSMTDYLSDEGVCYFDAGIDLYAPESKEVKGKKTEKIDHKVKCSMNKVETDGSERPVCYYLYPRSSTGAKTPLRLGNSVGIIDTGYRGNIIAIFDNITEKKYNVEKNDRLVQICAPNIEYPLKLNIVESLEELGITERGEGGLGSSGR